MSFLPFLVATAVAAAGAILTRRSRRVSLALGLGGLAVAFVAAVAITPGDTLVIGQGAIVTTDYQRLYLVLGTASGLLISIVGLATAWQRNVPAALLAALGWAGLALALPDPTTAVLATIGAGLAGILVTLVAPINERGVEVGARELRAVAVAGAIALVAVAWVAASGGGDVGSPAIGLAYLAIVVALALRFGVIPFHAWAGRLSQSAPETALPLLLAWAPACFAVVALAWTDATIVPSAASLGLERSLVVAIGAASLILGTFAAWIQDDIEHVVGYSIAQDAGFIILAFAALDPGSWAPARTWILIFVLVKTAFAGWALAVRSAHGTRRIDALAGWARRSPALGVTLVLVVLATIGWPGSTAWSARGDLIRLAATGPLAVLITLGGLSSLLYYLRLLTVGVRAPGDAVRDRAALRLRWPRSMLGAGRTGVDGGPPAGTAAAPARTAAAPAEGSAPTGEVEPRPIGTEGPSDVAPPSRTALERVAQLVRRVLAVTRAAAGGAGPTWRANRALAATAIVLVLALTALAAAAGGLGIPEAAAGPPPEAPPSASPVPSAASLP